MTNPLGKSIDFVGDDVENMQKEFERERREAIKCEARWEELEKTREEYVAPLLE